MGRARLLMMPPRLPAGAVSSSSRAAKRERGRVLVFLLTTLAAWLVSGGSAWAAAPMCDDRAASSYAPDPTLDPQNASVDTTHLAASSLASEPCNDGVERDTNFHQGRGRSPAPTPEGANAMLTASAPAVVGAGVIHVPRDIDVIAPESPEEGRLERPPRAL